VGRRRRRRRRDPRRERAYDEKAHLEIEPNSRAGRRTMPTVGALLHVLVEHKANQTRADALVFGADAPFQASNLWRSAQSAWKRAGVDPIGLHEATHTFASILIAAA
jgi:hypothetical protein